MVRPQYHSKVARLQRSGIIGPYRKQDSEEAAGEPPDQLHYL